MSRPEAKRAASTNLGGGNFRTLEGKLGIVCALHGFDSDEERLTRTYLGHWSIERLDQIKDLPDMTSWSTDTIYSPGIGAATCENLASKGLSLVMNYTSDKSADITKQLAEQLETNYGVTCLPVQADMSSEKGPEYIVETARNHFAHPKSGKFQIDVIINNAGVANKAALEECTLSDFDWLYKTNVRGPLLLMQAAMKYLPKDRSGRVVNLSSVSASCGFNGDSMYGGTKAALEAMTRTWARELAERCTVNAVNPGPVATDMYAATSDEFQKKMSDWTRNTPLAAIRPDVDRKDLVDKAELAGGRPVSASEGLHIVNVRCRNADRPFRHMTTRLRGSLQCFAHLTLRGVPAV